MTRFIRLAVGACVAGAGLLAAAPGWRPNDVQRRDRPAEPGHRQPARPRSSRRCGSSPSSSRPRRRRLQHHLLDRRRRGSCIGRREHRERDRSRRNRRDATTPGRPAVTNNSCTFATGQKADVGISDVFYEACANVTQPKPADVMDIVGPAQAMVFVVPKANTTTQYLTYKEAQTLYGCGVSATRTIAGFSMPGGVFCRDAELGHADHHREEHRRFPKRSWCRQSAWPTAAAGAVVTGVTAFRRRAKRDRLHRGRRCSTPTAPRSTRSRSQALGQTKAYYSPTPTSDVADRKNVRDGHYTIWGYEHFIAQRRPLSHGRLTSSATSTARRPARAATTSRSKAARASFRSAR